MNTAARPRGPEVERQEAEAGEAERERERERQVVLVQRRGVDREVAAGDRGQRRGEPVHVVEQVERVGDADEPDDRDDGRDDVVADQLDAQTRRDGDSRRRELRRELRERAQMPDVVHEPGGEEQARRRGSRAAPRSPRRRRRRPPHHAAIGRAKMPTPPKSGVGALVPPLAGRECHQPSASAESGGAPRSRRRRREGRRSWRPRSHRRVEAGCASCESLSFPRKIPEAGRCRGRAAASTDQTR